MSNLPLTMITVGSGKQARRFTKARTTQIIDPAPYKRKAAADEKRWNTSYAKLSTTSFHARAAANHRLQFEALKPPPAYYHASPLMRLPAEIRLQILTEVLFDPDEITFNFNVPKPSALFLDALRQHAIQLPSTYAKSYSGYSLEALLSVRLAPQWKNQTFVELQQNAPGQLPKRFNARKLYRILHGECLPRHEACLECYVRCRCREDHSAQCPHNRANGQVLRVCKAIYYDALPLLYNLNVFAFENAQLFHGGVLWDYVLPCRMIRQLYFPESFRYIMKQDGKTVEVDIDRAPEFFSGWMVRGGEAFLDMVRARERGENDPLGILNWHAGCEDVELDPAANRALRAWLPVKVNKKAHLPAPTQQSHGWYLPVLAHSGPTSRGEAVKYHVWKDGPLGPEKSEEPSLRFKALCRLYNATLLLWISVQAIRRGFVQASDELKVELRRFKALLTIRYAVALPWLFIKGGAYTVYGAYALVMCIPGSFVLGTLLLIILLVYLHVQFVRETINLLTIHILGTGGVLSKVPRPSAGKRHTNGNGRRRE
ncbi:hypothetical protein PMIN06_005899 [Paraphaeosphaeria minitans]